VHGANRRNKASDFKVRLIEKQKARWHFGILEKQFQRYVRRASSMKGSTGLNLVHLLQSRLDSLIWSIGLARTIPAARQLVVHGHIMVNGKRVDRPSYHVSAGDELAVHPKSQTKPFLLEAIGDSAGRRLPSWLEFDAAKFTGRLITAPDRGDLPFELNENAIVEFYSQKL